MATTGIAAADRPERHSWRRRALRQGEGELSAEAMYRRIASQARALGDRIRPRQRRDCSCSSSAVGPRLQAPINPAVSTVAVGLAQIVPERQRVGPSRREALSP